MPKESANRTGYILDHSAINESERASPPFYQSILYKAVVLDNLAGFTEVYSDGDVKIFQLTDGIILYD
jgi:hypothetical protein